MPPQAAFSRLPSFTMSPPLPCSSPKFGHFCCFPSALTHGDPKMGHKFSKKGLLASSLCNAPRPFATTPLLKPSDRCDYKTWEEYGIALDLSAFEQASTWASNTHSLWLRKASSKLARSFTEMNIKTLRDRPPWTVGEPRVLTLREVKKQLFLLQDWLGHKRRLQKKAVQYFGRRYFVGLWNSRAGFVFPIKPETAYWARTR